MSRRVKLQYEISESSELFDLELGITPQIRKLLTDSYFDLQKKKPALENRLYKLIEQYPNIPQFKNYLACYYDSTGNKDKAYEINAMLVNAHPDYLFGKLALIEKYREEKDYKKIKVMLGNHPDISNWYPERSTFHYNEVKHFELKVISYYLHVHKPDEADSHIKKLKTMGIYDEEVELYERKLLLERMQKGLKRWEKTRKEARSVVPVSPKTIANNGVKPVFTHSLVQELYKHGMNIDHELIKQILSLPRVTLIRDLHKVVYDSINRYDYFVNETTYAEATHTFMFHAIFLLTELKSEESLQVVLDILRQDDKFIDFWFFDVLSHVMWECLFVTGQNKLNELLDFLKEPNRDCYNRTEVSTAISQLAIYQPGRREEVICLYKDLLQYFLQHKDDDRLIDTDLIGMIVSDILEIPAPELIPGITEIYRNKLVNPGMAGSLIKVLKEFEMLQLYDKKRNVYDIYGRYREILTWWNRNNDDDSSSGFDNEEDNDGHTYNALPFERSSPRIGRNDPCPCGSGKKYKKCCIDKFEE